MAKRKGKADGKPSRAERQTFDAMVAVVQAATPQARLERWLAHVKDECLNLLEPHSITAWPFNPPAEPPQDMEPEEWRMLRDAAEAMKSATLVGVAIAENNPVLAAMEAAYCTERVKLLQIAPFGKFIANGVKATEAIRASNDAQFHARCEAVRQHRDAYYATLPAGRRRKVERMVDYVRKQTGLARSVVYRCLKAIKKGDT
jgi:hypothetical protein